MGQGIPPSLPDALRWLTRAAEAGDVPAQTQLASLALRGVHPAPPGSLFVPDPNADPDYHSAERWSRRAADGGSADGKALLGLILAAGASGPCDPEAARACYREAADHGSARGRLALAMALLTDGEPAAAREAQALLRAVAAEHIPAAEYLAGALAESGAAGSPDYREAAKCYHAAAEQGHAAAQLRFGLALLAGRGVDQDVFAAETWLRRAASGGEALAAAAIGDLYARPDGALPPNYAEAASWYERAAELGHAGSALQLGRAYLLGRGLRRDTFLAAHWLRAAIRGGEEMAQVHMAQLSLDRQSSEDDQRETAAWLRRLAEAGNPAAWFNLGLCLAEGVGLPRNANAARDCFIRASPAVPAARLRLAQMEAAASTAAMG
ncbi:MAG: sel1 repeat family protein [Proteobacteria bacterium]|nr:sel1 repeat family protein [Pseudomonadota bacterium]